MRNFYFAPRVNLKKSMENILLLFKKQGYSREELESILYNPHGFKSDMKFIPTDRNLLDKDLLDKDSKFSEQTYYDWLKGDHFPQLDIILLMAQLLQKPVEHLFIYDLNFVESDAIEKSKNKNEKGTGVHSVRKSIFFEDEDSTIEELQKKYPKEFEELIGINEEYFNIGDNEYLAYYYAENPKDVFVKPSTDPEEIKESISQVLKKLNIPPKILIKILDEKNVQTISNWKRKERKPKTETLLNFARFLNYDFIQFCRVSFCATKKVLFDFMQFDVLYEKIHNRNIFEDEYNEYKLTLKKQEEDYFAFLDDLYAKDRAEWDKKSLTELIEEDLLQNTDNDFPKFEPELHFLYYMQERMERENFHDEFISNYIKDHLENY